MSELWGSPQVPEGQLFSFSCLSSAQAGTVLDPPTCPGNSLYSTSSLRVTPVGPCSHWTRAEAGLLITAWLPRGRGEATCPLSLPESAHVSPSPRSCPEKVLAIWLGPQFLTRMHASVCVCVLVGHLNSNCDRETRQGWSLGAFNYLLILQCLEKGFLL